MNNLLKKKNSPVQTAPELFNFICILRFWNWSLKNWLLLNHNPFSLSYQPFKLAGVNSIPCFENNIDKDQLASDETCWFGSVFYHKIIKTRLAGKIDLDAGGFGITLASWPNNTARNIVWQNVCWVKTCTGTGHPDMTEWLLKADWNSSTSWSL